MRTSIRQVCSMITTLWVVAGCVPNPNNSNPVRDSGVGDGSVGTDSGTDARVQPDTGGDSGPEVDGGPGIDASTDSGPSMGCTDTTTYYADTDGDGYGDAFMAAEFCEGEAPAGWVETGDDCDDGCATCNLGVVEEACSDFSDNNCDGNVDEDCECEIGTTQSCGLTDVGECTFGSQECSDGFWSGCVGATRPTDETCDGLDNDCDAQLDNGVSNACGTCGEVPEEVCNGSDDDCDGLVDEDVTNACGDCGDVPAETCNGTDDDCDGERDEGVTNECGECGEVPPEMCDGLDNNCDGTADEGVTNECGECGEVPAEICDALDNDCDGETDEGVTNACGECGDVPAEVCDSDDNDCDGETDEGVTNACGECGDVPAELCGDELDNDCDGVTDELDCACVNGSVRVCGTTDTGECEFGTQLCSGGIWGACEGNVEPAATEACDLVDDDCDGTTDEDCACVTSSTRSCGETSVGECAFGTQTCDAGEWGAECVGGVGATREICDDLDNDCNGFTDEGCDNDNDNYCDATMTTVGTPTTCTAGGNDCADANPMRNPGLAEVCDEIDNDCDGMTDEGVTTTYYRDADRDSYGTTQNIQACSRPTGSALRSGDCDDTRFAVKPGATETCNTRDDDCDGMTDEDVATTYYRDADGDTYGDAAMPLAACATAPSGYASNNTDCNDASGSRFPGATETCNDADDDCDSTTDEGCDDDDDDYCDAAMTRTGTPSVCPLGGNDCRDADGTVNPSVAEVCDAIDNDCSGVVDNGSTLCEFTGDRGDMICRAGACEVNTCDTGYFDCDDNYASGCESRITWDANGVGGITSLDCNYVQSMDAGADHSCAVMNGGLLKCWGENSLGQLGLGTTDDSAVAVQVPDLYGVSSVATGVAGTCAVKNDGTVYCWGTHLGGYGDGATRGGSIPVRVPGLTGAHQVEVGWFHDCARTDADGDGVDGIECWGLGGSGAIGNGSTSSPTTPTSVTGVFRTADAMGIALGNSFSCGRIATAPYTYCWGEGDNYRLGHGDTADYSSPVPVTGLTSRGVMSAGDASVCMKTATAGLVCWGDNEAGQVGNGTFTDASAPVAVSETWDSLMGAGTTVGDFSVGATHACAVTNLGYVYCWGNNESRQLGDTTITNRNRPVRAGTFAGSVSEIVAGRSHTCALLTNNADIICWGKNESGQLGRNDFSTHTASPGAMDETVNGIQ